MKEHLNQSGSTTKELLRIGGSNLKLVQFMDYPRDTTSGHQVLVNFSRARLSDANDQELFSGTVIVRLASQPSPASLAIISRLLQPFTGYFVMVVTGTYNISGSVVEVYADDVSWTNIQPVALSDEEDPVLVPLGI